MFIKLVYKEPTHELICDSLTPKEAVEKWKHLASKDMWPAQMFIDNVPAPAEYGFLVDLANTAKWQEYL